MSTAHVPADPVNRLAALGEILPFTALRGVAAWWVVLYHFREYLPAGPITDAIRPTLARGALAVDLFFIMSGFVMALSYGASFRAGVTRREWLHFIALRLGRIYPVHLLVLILFISVPSALAVTGRPGMTSQFSPGYFVESLFLVQTCGFVQGLAWNLPAWSISTEMMFYLVCPFVLFGTARYLVGLRPLLGSMACVLVMIGCVGLAAGSLTDGIDRFGVFRCIGECTAGVLLFRLAALIGAPGWLGAGLLLTAAACAWACATGVAPDYVVVPLCFVCLLWALLNPAQWLGIVLSNAVFLWLGRLSYATYMVHFLVKYWVKFLLLDHVSLPVFFTVYLGTVLLGSVALHSLVELPSRRAARTLIRCWFAPVAPQPAGWRPARVSEGVPD